MRVKSRSGLIRVEGFGSRFSPPALRPGAWLGWPALSGERSSLAETPPLPVYYEESRGAGGQVRKVLVSAFRLSTTLHNVGVLSLRRRSTTAGLRPILIQYEHDMFCFVQKMNGK